MKRKAAENLPNVQSAYGQSSLGIIHSNIIKFQHLFRRQGSSARYALREKYPRLYEPKRLSF